MNSGDLHFSTLVSIVCWNVSSPPSWSLCILSCILNKTDLLVTPIKLKHTSTLYTMICSWLPDAVKVEPAGLSPDPGRVDLSETLDISSNPAPRCNEETCQQQIFPPFTRSCLISNGNQAGTLGKLQKQSYFFTQKMIK